MSTTTWILVKNWSDWKKLNLNFYFQKKSTSIAKIGLNLPYSVQTSNKHSARMGPTGGGGSGEPAQVEEKEANVVTLATQTTLFDSLLKS